MKASKLKIMAECKIELKDCNSPREKYKALENSLKDIISEIDTETPFQEHEPNWWVDMMAIQRILLR